MSEELPADSKGQIIVFGAKQIRRASVDDQFHGKEENHPDEIRIHRVDGLEGRSRVRSEETELYDIAVSRGSPAAR